MNSQDLSEALETFATRGGDMEEQYELVKRIESSALGLDAVSAILAFYERHEDLDTGAPGPLAHFVETFYKAGYERLLAESVQRKPTLKTLELLNRLVNGTDEPQLRDSYVSLVEQAARSDSASFDTKEEAFRLLARYNGQSS